MSGEFVERIIANFEVTGSDQDVDGALALVADRYPGTDEASRFELKRAAFWRQAGNLLKATDILRAVTEQHPDNAHSRKAWLLLATYLGDLNEHDEMYHLLQTFMLRYPEETRMGTARYLSAVSEATIGLVEEARLHIQELSEEAEFTDVHHLCLYWLAIDAIGRQDYDLAESYFTNLIQRFPEERLAAEGRRMMAQLDARKLNDRN